MQNPITGVHHIAIIVSNYAISKKFYTEIIGGVVINETYRPQRQSHKLDLLLPCGTQLEIFTFEGAPPRFGLPHSREACGLRHLAFKVKNLSKALRYLEMHGIAHQGIRTDEITGKRFTFFQDPDHLPLEFYEK